MKKQFKQILSKKDLLIEKLKDYSIFNWELGKLNLVGEIICYSL